jgi:hypothetical protein
MNDENESKDSCSIHPEDEEGNANLCCCYALDQDGNLIDPCYKPVEDCYCCE